MRKSIFLFVFLLIPFLHFGQTHSLLKNIGQGDDHGIPSVNQATVWNGKSYFISYDPNFYKNRIWSTKGTSSTSFQVLTTSYPDIEFLTSVDDYLIFNAWPETDRGIFRSNGTQAGTQLIREFPSQQIVFMQRLNNTTVVFITEDFISDSTYVWATDGTANGTINLGYFEIKPDFLKFSYYKNSIILTEKSTNLNLFPPVITDGTIDGTMLVTDFINNIIPDDISNVESAVGTTDFLFVNTSTGGKVFNGTSANNFNLAGDYIFGFKIDQKHIIFSTYYIEVYDGVTGVAVELAIEPYYFSEPISNNEYVFFHNSGGYVYKTNGTPSGTKKISSITIGSSLYDPYLFATEDLLLYGTDQGSNTELWVVDLQSDTDSLFNVIKPAGNPIVDPYAFASGGNIIYARYTPEAGREYWVYENLPTGVADLSWTQQIVLSPNPAENELTISMGNGMPFNSNFSIYNAAGQFIRSYSVAADKMQVDVSGFSPGQYSIQFQTSSGNQNGGSFVKK